MGPLPAGGGPIELMLTWAGYPSPALPVRLTPDNANDGDSAAGPVACHVQSYLALILQRYLALRPPSAGAIDRA